jgi:hypothetical protein
MNKKYFYVITVLLTTILIFSLGLSCSFCGSKLALTSDDNLNPANAGGSINTSEDGQNYKNNGNEEIQATSEETLSEKELLIALEEKAKALEAVKNANQDSQSQQTESNNTVAETVALKDNRFVIIIETMQKKNEEYSYAKGNDPNFYEITDYFLNLGIPQEQIHIYWGQNQDGGTYDNFVKAIDDVKKLSNSGCSVLVALMSHGNEEADAGAPAMMEFANGMGNEHGGRYISYYDVCSLLDRITCEKMAVIISSCALADSARPVAENTSAPRIAIAPITFQEILNYIFTDKGAVDRDSDGKYSIKDVFEFIKDPSATKNPGRYTGVEMIDPFDIAGQVYLN